jgi:Domain of unknown function (DUF1772)
MSHHRLLDALQFFSLIVVAVALIPAGAHLFELPNKIALPPEQYMVVQNIYRGWALFGVVTIVAPLLALMHAFAVRAHTGAMLLSVVAALCLAAVLGVFFMFTYPMNVATSNWTVTPENFEAARRQWEYSHAVNAGLMLVAFATLTLSVMASRHSPAV